MTNCLVFYMLRFYKVCFFLLYFFLFSGRWIAETKRTRGLWVVQFILETARKCHVLPVRLGDFSAFVCLLRGHST